MRFLFYDVASTPVVIKKNWPRRLNEISRRLASWDQTTNDKWVILSFAQQNQPTHENPISCKIYSNCSKNLKKKQYDILLSIMEHMFMKSCVRNK